MYSITCRNKSPAPIHITKVRMKGFPLDQRTLCHKTKKTTIIAVSNLVAGTGLEPVTFGL